MAFSLKKWLKEDENDIFASDGTSDTYYNKTPEEATLDNGKSKMILLEPRAYSESQQIVDHLKARNTVVVNLKRVTSDQAKRIVDFWMCVQIKNMYGKMYLQNHIYIIIIMDIFSIFFIRNRSLNIYIIRSK